MSETCVFCGTPIRHTDESWPFCPDCLEEAIEDYARRAPHPTFWRLASARFFSWVFERHITHAHNASYDVCPHWLCRIAWFAERWLWYGGEA